MKICGRIFVVAMMAALLAAAPAAVAAARRTHTVVLGAAKKVPYSKAGDPAGAAVDDKELKIRALLVDGDATGDPVMFRRAKLWLDAIAASVLERAVHQGALIGRLGLTDPAGNPLCASVRPPLIEWSTGASE